MSMNSDLAVFPGAMITARMIQGIANGRRGINAAYRGKGWGVVRMDRKDSVHAEVSEDALTISLDGFEGVARNGREIRIPSGDPIRSRLPLRGRTSIEFCWGIVLDWPGDASNQAEAYHLTLEEVATDEAGAAASPEIDLPLGTLKWSAEEPGQPRFTRLPWPLTLTAIGPHDAEYLEWLEPWSSLLKQIWAEARTADPAKAAVLASLVMDWSTLTCSGLAERVSQIGAMDQSPENPFLWSLWGTALDPTRLLDGITTEGLPRALAASASTSRARPSDQRRLSQPDEFVPSWSGDFLTLEFPRRLPAGLLELRLPRQAETPECVFCQVGLRYAAWAVPRVNRGAYSVFPLSLNEAGHSGMPLTVSPLNEPADCREEIQLWVVN